ncbi:hypothetical protein FZEAL_7685 [Fusarium zealandicum]|uniref:Xylanolytic transcriptional activator regulatory domain-containing protein n=1 Tax=Fusarium zealandicum TaxID=1053134 RepID=A0A8H4UFI5_9HYPO|nr:hypothetical protein FZEAL_7685 [Fusarium zealandicum]
MEASSAPSHSPSRRVPDDPPEHGRPPKRPREDPVRPRLDCQFTAANRRGQVLPAIDAATDDAIQKQLSEQAQQPDTTSTRGDSNRGGRRESLAEMASSRLTPTATAEPAMTSPAPARPSVETRSDHSPRSRLGHEARETGHTAQQAQHTRSIRNSPEPSQTDEQGHFVGPSSGVSFLLRIQRKLQIQSPGYLNSSMFNFGDRPLPGHDSSFAILPPRPLAESMMKRYFDFAATTHRFLHRPSIEACLEELYETNGTMLYQESARSRTALLFMVFAHSNNYRSRLSVDTRDRIAESAESGARFFAVAERQLSMEKGEIRLAHVQARLAQCFYLLAQSRLNHCWTLFGVTAQLAMALGIHRRSRIDLETSSRVDHVDLECRKRTFWCAYNLNTYLSASLGRPMTFHEEDIDQELPLCVDDDQLRFGPAPQPVVRGPSITSATVAQIMLSRILARILRALYGIHPRSIEEHFTFAAKFTRDLAEWRQHISYLLDTDGSSAIFVKLVLRQRDVLRLAFWHAQILVHRPFLLKSFTSLTGYERRGGNLLPARQLEMQENIKICIDAATRIIEHIDHINSAGELYSTLFFIPYYGFSAVVIIYVYAIQQRAELPETYSACFSLATKCHAQLESIATQGSLMQRYGVVLQELRLEVLRLNDYLASVSTPQAGGEFPGAEAPLAHAGLLRSSQGGQALMEQRYGGTSLDTGLGARQAESLNGPGVGYRTGGDIPTTSTASSIDVIDGGLAHMASWGQFDSLVTGGTGTLDAMLQGGSTDIWGNLNDTGFNTW